jgi:hypothetical protein
MEAMNVKSIKTRFNEVFLIPMGDLHIGDKSFNSESERKLQGYIDWVKEKPNAFVFLMGDILNDATVDSASSPFQQNMDLKEQIDYATKLFRPIKHKIIGAISGNHEQRLEKYSGYNPTIALCDRLGIFYYGYDGIVIFRLGCHNGKCKDKSPRASFVGYFHHTTGGGATVGGKMNRVEKLRDVIVDADFYCGAHNHMLGCVHSGIFRINETTEQVEFIRQMLIDCGGYLNYDGSYANMKMLPPVKLGSPKIRMLIKRSGKDEVKKDIHVSL